jgi:esterase FrsA
MNDVDELKKFVVVHARGQKIPRYRELLDRITHDGEGPGSWAGEWCAAAAALERRGRHLDACRHYAMARFPFADGPARQAALAGGVAALDHWRFSAGMDIHRLDLPIGDGRVRCWASGLSAAEPRPLLLIMGGIVTVKEQWAPLLAQIGRLGMAGIVTEMPGVGENTLRYEAGSWRMISELLDAVADVADVSQTYAMNLSFSGHLALRCALQDERIRGVITTGAPISEFFTDLDWHARLPRVTTDTLAHLTWTDPAELAESMRDWALTGDQLASLDIPVCYVASSQDEIIPAGDPALLARHVRDLHLIEHDDVHGSPGHVIETRLWSVLSLFRIRGISNVQSAAFGLLWRAAKARRALSGSRA